MRSSSMGLLDIVLAFLLPPLIVALRTGSAISRVRREAEGRI